MRAVRNAARAAHPCAQNGPSGRTGVQQFAEKRIGEHRALAAKGRTSQAGFAPVARRSTSARSGRPRADGGSRGLRARGLPRHRRASPHRIAARRGDFHCPEDAITIIATGPLTSGALAEEIGRLTGAERLFFYDSISPIVEADSIDLSIAFRASRYGKSLDGTDDYVNCPFDREQYERFLDAILAAEAFLRTLPKTTPDFSKPACPSKSSPGAGARRCASVR